MKLFLIVDTSYNMFEYYVVYAIDKNEAIEKYLEPMQNKIPLKYLEVTEIDPVNHPYLIASVR